MAPTKISLIVCTRNRADGLPRFLEYVSALEPPSGGWELVLVDNGSTDATRQVIEDFARSATMPVRHVYAPVPGLARGRNAGLAAASGEVLAFTDDDCYPQPDYLRALAKVFEEYQPGFVGGRVVLHDPADARIAVKDIAEAIAVPSNSYVRPGLIHGANMAIARGVVRAIGGFDPLLGAGTPCIAGEDTEYLARAAWAGWPGRYDPRPVVAHHHGRKPGPDAERHVRGYDYGRGAYFARFLMHRQAWPTYLRFWCRHAWKHRKPSRMATLGRESVGAARYVKGRLGRTDAVPRFDNW